MALTLHEFEEAALPTLLEYATIEAISPAYDPEWIAHGGIARATALLAEWARARQLAEFEVAVHELDGRTPVITVTVAATSPVLGTVLFYGHLDKQPPLGDWSEGLAPFAPVRRGDRIFARGVADDGYSIFAALLALEQLERDGIPHARCVVLIEASEESGSPDLAAHLAQLSDTLGDVELLVCLDSGALSYDRLWVTSSLRGNLIAHVRVDVLERGVHSGMASGVVPSSFRIQRALLDRLEDSRTGVVRVPELIGEIPASHREAARRLTDEFGDVARSDLPVVGSLSLMGDDAADRELRRTWAATLSVTGVAGVPDAHEAGNVLRPFTTLVISLRLPPSVDADVASAAVLKVLRENPPENAQVTVTIQSAADGWLSPPLAPWLARALDDASREAFGCPAEFCGEGGTIPFLAVLQAAYPTVQFVATGVLGPGSNAHGIDEMLDLPMTVGVTNAVADIVGAHARAGEPN
jgi:acetylornithine deacetylase/succinyl-diaminopimelate desuccinylase-like protein